MMPPAVDLSRLEDCSDGTAADVRALVDEFLSDVGDTIHALGSAVDGGHVADVALLAHRAAGASGACGAARLAELLRAFEERARGGQLDGSSTLMREVDEELARVALFLERYLETGGPAS